LLPPPLHAFSTDRIETVCSRKTIYVRFDLNDYSIPPEAVGRQLTLVASDITVRILDGSFEIARHARTYDRHQLVLDPAHQDAVLKIKRKAFHSRFFLNLMPCSYHRGNPEHHSWDSLSLKRPATSGWPRCLCNA
jgi:hypothetical protein